MGIVMLEKPFLPAKNACIALSIVHALLAPIVRKETRTEIRIITVKEIAVVRMGKCELFNKIGIS